jgi:hypothetical protein
VASRLNRWLSAMSRGNRIDVRAQGYARSEPYPRRRISNYARGADFVDPYVAVWWDITTRRKWRHHTIPYGPGAVEVPTNK